MLSSSPFGHSAEATHATDPATSGDTRPRRVAFGTRASELILDLQHASGLTPKDYLFQQLQRCLEFDRTVNSLQGVEEAHCLQHHVTAWHGDIMIFPRHHFPY